LILRMALGNHAGQRLMQPHMGIVAFETEAGAVWKKQPKQGFALRMWLGKGCFHNHEQGLVFENLVALSAKSNLRR
jgi:hypothetical protein